MVVHVVAQRDDGAPDAGHVRLAADGEDLERELEAVARGGGDLRAGVRDEAHVDSRGAEGGVDGEVDDAVERVRPFVEAQEGVNGLSGLVTGGYGPRKCGCARILLIEWSVH